MQYGWMSYQLLRNGFRESGVRTGYVDEVEGWKREDGLRLSYQRGIYRKGMSTRWKDGNGKRDYYVHKIWNIDYRKGMWTRRKDKKKNELTTTSTKSRKSIMKREGNGQRWKGYQPNASSIHPRIHNSRHSPSLITSIHYRSGKSHSTAYSTTYNHSPLLGSSDATRDETGRRRAFFFFLFLGGRGGFLNSGIIDRGFFLSFS